VGSTPACPPCYAFLPKSFFILFLFTFLFIAKSIDPGHDSQLTLGHDSHDSQLTMQISCQQLNYLMTFDLQTEFFNRPHRDMPALSVIR
jgi:hypothetical protein